MSTKKQSHNRYNFLGLSGNHVHIYLVKLIKLDLLGYSDGNGNGGGGGGANLPVCRIFRKDIDLILIHR